MSPGGPLVCFVQSRGNGSPALNPAGRSIAVLWYLMVESSSVFKKLISFGAAIRKADLKQYPGSF